MLGLPILMVLMAAGIGVYRIACGPTSIHRLMGGDSFGLSLALAMMLAALALARPMILDVVMVYGVVLFADILLLAKFLERGDIHLE
ncbi:MAG: hypothetical protein GX030_03065 [Firmicutes bacterium]|nr:hypothetical protein [Bacillota bacterium]